MMMDPNTSSTSTAADSTVVLSVVCSHQQQSLAEMNQEEQRVLIADTSDGTATRAMNSCHQTAADTMPLHRPPNSNSITTASRRTSRNRSRRTLLASTLSPLLLLIALASDNFAFAQRVDGECACSPRQFVFRLNLAANCPALPPPFPPNDVFQGGVKDYVCTIGPEAIPQAPQSMTSEDTALPLVIPDEDEDSTRRMQGSGVGKVYNNSAADYFPELTNFEIDIEELEWSSANLTTSAVTITDDDVDIQPVSIYSIQFLEVDTAFNVINQDSAYVRGIDFVSGDVFNYTSISAQDPESDVIPGGMNMVLRGVNADGEPVRNVFTITYTNDCGLQTFNEGDAIGWVVFENFEPASEETCGPLIPTTSLPSPSITPKPSTMSPTMKPTDGTLSPTRKDSTPRPTRRPSRKPSIIQGKSSKSDSKGSKSDSKSSKGSKSSKSKSSKSYGKSTEDGSSWNHGYAPSDGYASHSSSSSPKASKRRQPDADNEPIRGRDLRAADAASFTDTLIEEIDLDRYFLLDNDNDQKDEEEGVRQQAQRHLRR